MKGIPVWQDRLGRILLVLSAISAAGAFVGGLAAAASATPDRLWLETWRTLGFLVFTGLFALLAWRPRTTAGVWELVIVNKGALSILGLVYRSAESLSAVPFDLALTAVLAAAYLLTRGWRSWMRIAAT